MCVGWPSFEFCLGWPSYLCGLATHVFGARVTSDDMPDDTHGPHGKYTELPHTPLKCTTTCRCVFEGYKGLDAVIPTGGLQTNQKLRSRRAFAVMAFEGPTSI